MLTNSENHGDLVVVTIVQRASEIGPLKGKWRRYCYILMQAHDCGTRALRFPQSRLLNHQRSDRVHKLRR